MSTLINYETDGNKNISDALLTANAALELAISQQNILNAEKIKAAKEWVLGTCEDNIRHACSNGETFTSIEFPETLDKEIVKSMLAGGYYSVEFIQVENTLLIQISWDSTDIEAATPSIPDSGNDETSAD